MSAFSRTVLPKADVSSDEPIGVLIALPPSTDPASLKGVMSVLTQTTTASNDCVFTFQTCGPDSVYETVKAALPENVAKHLPTPVMTISEAVEDPLADFDILVVPHLTSDPPESPGQNAEDKTFFGHSRRKSYTNADTIAIAPDDQLAALIGHWASIQRENTVRERSLLTIGTGTLSAARAGALRRLAASIHPSLLTRLELECQAATLAASPDEERTLLVDESVDPEGSWYVVSNARFGLEDVEAAAAAAADAEDEALDVVDDELPSPRVGSRKSGSFGTKAVGKAVPGNVGRRYSKRRESISRRDSLPSGGLRVITASESAAATDSALYLVAAMHSLDRAQEIAYGMGHDWRKGMTVGAVDV